MRSFLKNRKKKTIYMFLLLIRNISVEYLKNILNQLQPVYFLKEYLSETGSSW